MTACHYLRGLAVFHLPFALLFAAHSASAPDSTHCTAAARLLRTGLHMQAVVEGDTIDDWRTGKQTPGCRITAAGGTTIGVQKEAVRFYERVRAAGWVRTPEPRDAPTEASLRFRWEASDCLFNVNGQQLLNTDAEAKVNATLVLAAGESAYQVFVMCVPVAPAKPR